MAEAKSKSEPIQAGRTQPGEAVSAPLTTRVPRGVDELPSDSLAVEPGARAVQEHLNELVARENRQGYRGDPSKNRTPNANYTLAGVGKGLPTPETNVHTPSSK